MTLRIVRTRSEPLSIYEGDTRIARVEMPYPGDRTTPATPTVSGRNAQRIVDAVNTVDDLRTENARLRAALEAVVSDVDEHARSIRALGEAANEEELWLAVSHDTVQLARAALDGAR